MVIKLMTETERQVARRKCLKDHIRLLEGRYSEAECREVVDLLKSKLAKLENFNGGCCGVRSK
jgi:hypothetical protein